MKHIITCLKILQQLWKQLILITKSNQFINQFINQHKVSLHISSQNIHFVLLALLLCTSCMGLPVCSEPSSNPHEVRFQVLRPEFESRYWEFILTLSSNPHALYYAVVRVRDPCSTYWQLRLCCVGVQTTTLFWMHVFFNNYISLIYLDILKYLES
jgi:hypothetical protein